MLVAAPRRRKAERLDPPGGALADRDQPDRRALVQESDLDSVAPGVDDGPGVAALAEERDQARAVDERRRELAEDHRTGGDRTGADDPRRAQPAAGARRARSGGRGLLGDAAVLDLRGRLRVAHRRLLRSLAGRRLGLGRLRRGLLHRLLVTAAGEAAHTVEDVIGHRRCPCSRLRRSWASNLSMAVVRKASSPWWC